MQYVNTQRIVGVEGLLKLMQLATFCSGVTSQARDKLKEIYGGDFGVSMNRHKLPLHRPPFTVFSKAVFANICTCNVLVLLSMFMLYQHMNMHMHLH